MPQRSTSLIITFRQVRAPLAFFKPYRSSALLRKKYNVGQVPAGKKNVHAIAAFDDYYEALAVATFHTAIDQDVRIRPPETLSYNSLVRNYS